MSDFDQIVGQLRDAVTSVSLDRQMPEDDLRDVLSFLVKVAQVVDQSFQDVLTLAIELAYLSPADASSDRISRLQMEIELLTARSHYRESLEICSRLKHLKAQFEQHIRPTIQGFTKAADWQQLFWLIEDREGRIIRLVESTAWTLRNELDRARNSDVRGVNATARSLVAELRPLLADLRDMTNQILGLSGREGFLELTRDRSALRQAARIVINQGGFHMSGDVYNTRNAGAVGPNAQATNTTITENYGSILQDVDLQALAPQLAQLKREMLKKVDGTTDQLAAIAAISAAEDAARKSERSTVAEKLKRAGIWAFDVASKIGVSVAAEALKEAIGLG